MTLAIVEGEKEGIIYKIVSKTEENGALECYFQTFLKHEPLIKSLGMNYKWEERPYFVKQVKKFIKQGLSLVAIDSKTNLIVGSRITRCITNESLLLPSTTTIKGLLDMGFREDTAQIFIFFNKVWGQTSIADNFPGEEIVKFVGVGVKEEYSGKGIGSELARRGILLCKMKGYKLGIVNCSGLRSQKIFTKLGFVRHSAIQYEDYLNDDGNMVFQTEEKEAVAMYKVL